MSQPQWANSPIGEEGEAQPAVLVVEDDALTQLAISEHLKDCGFQVYGAATAVEAIDILQSAVPGLTSSSVTFVCAVTWMAAIWRDG